MYVDIIPTMEREAKEAGISIRKVLIRANVAYSTWTRWKNGADPQVSTVEKVAGALQDLIAERAS